MPPQRVFSTRLDNATSFGATGFACGALLPWALVVAALGVTGCDVGPSSPANRPAAIQGGASNLSLLESRRGFKTTLRPENRVREPVAEPPAEVFSKVFYETPAGRLAAYLTPDPRDGAKHPAIVWITGGDCNSISDVWSDAPSSNDQTAAAFRKAGIVLMFPSLRGGNDNPGIKEGFLGEVDDVGAAADYLAKQGYVDANRIYLGGHSTGGTLVLLVAECNPHFRAVFSFGPAADVSGYPAEFLPFDTSNRREIELRSPWPWLGSIKSPVFVIEGTVDSNLDSLQAMARNSTNPQAHFLEVQGADHFSVLAPVCAVLAQKVLNDNGNAGSLSVSSQELTEAFARSR